MNKLKRLYYRFWHHNGSLYVQALYGKFRVKYPDGAVSQKFSYRTAKSYQAIFGGEIIEDF
jgi:hypothetical protein